MPVTYTQWQPVAAKTLAVYQPELVPDMPRPDVLRGLAYGDVVQVAVARVDGEVTSDVLLVQCRVIENHRDRAMLVLTALKNTPAIGVVSGDTITAEYVHVTRTALYS